jgi:hypothetical protein
MKPLSIAYKVDRPSLFQAILLYNLHEIHANMAKLQPPILASPHHNRWNKFFTILISSILQFI